MPIERFDAKNMNEEGVGRDDDLKQEMRIHELKNQPFFTDDSSKIESTMDVACERLYDLEEKLNEHGSTLEELGHQIRHLEEREQRLMNKTMVRVEDITPERSQAVAQLNNVMISLEHLREKYDHMADETEKILNQFDNLQGTTKLILDEKTKTNLN